MSQDYFNGSQEEQRLIASAEEEEEPLWSVHETLWEIREHRQRGVERKIQEWVNGQNIFKEMIPPVHRELEKLHAQFLREVIAESAVCHISISNELFDCLFY